DQLDEPRAQGALPFGIETIVRGPVLRRGPRIQRVLALAMEPVRRPVRRHVAAVTPHRPDLHPTHRLPDVLASHDLPGPDDLAAVSRDDPLGNRRHLLVDACADPAEDREPEHDDDAECDPETPHESSLHLSPQDSRRVLIARQSAIATGKLPAQHDVMQLTYLLVHGSWQGAWCWDGVRAYLEARGHRVLSPTLPAHADPSENVGGIALADYV